MRNLSILLSLIFVATVALGAGRITNSDLTGTAGITNANLASMPTLTLKGNNTGGSATPLDLTAAQAKTLLSISASDLTNGVTGSGSIVLATSPTLVAPTLGAALATSINGMSLSCGGGSCSTSLAPGKSIAFNNSLSFSGTDGSTLDIGAGGTLGSLAFLSSPLGIANGGTGQTTASAAFGALSPLTTTGDLLYYTGGANTRLPIGTAGQCLTVSGGIPTWAACSGGGGGGTVGVAVKTANYALTNSDDVILCNASTEITISLHAVSGATVKPYRFKNIGAATCLLDADGADVFDRTTEGVVELPPGGIPTSAIELIPDSGGSSWSIF